MTLLGYDLSSNNSAADHDVAMSGDFVIVKASEGVGYVNPVGQPWAQDARDRDMLVGWYHYARPEKNGPEAEADAFLAAANPQPGEILALDFEPGSILPAYPSWVKAFSEIVTFETGAPCWFYTNASQGAAMVKLASPEQRTALWAMPLWKAYYQPTPGDLMGWPRVTCWQKTDSPLDTNEFFGDAALWRSLGVPEEDMAITPDDIEAIAKAVTERSWKKQPGNVDATSLRINAEWEDNQFAGLSKRLAAVEAALKALPVPPTAEEIADAVLDEDHRRSES